MMEILRKQSSKVLIIGMGKRDSQNISFSNLQSWQELIIYTNFFSFQIQ